MSVLLRSQCRTNGKCSIISCACGIFQEINWIRRPRSNISLWYPMHSYPNKTWWQLHNICMDANINSLIIVSFPIHFYVRSCLCIWMGIIVAAALSNVCRFTTTSSKVPLRLLQNKNVTQFITPKINITPITVIWKQMLLVAIEWMRIHRQYHKQNSFEYWNNITEMHWSPSNCHDRSESIGPRQSFSIVDHWTRRQRCVTSNYTSCSCIPIKATRCAYGHHSCNAYSLGIGGMFYWLRATCFIWTNIAKASTRRCHCVLSIVFGCIAVFDSNRYWH